MNEPKPVNNPARDRVRILRFFYGRRCIAVFLLYKIFRKRGYFIIEHLNHESIIQAYGWSRDWEDILAATTASLSGSKELAPGRIIAQYSHVYRVISSEGDKIAKVSGKFEYDAEARGDFPAVGDWVLIELLKGEPNAIIHAVLPRHSAMTRKQAGNIIEEQIIGANIDFVFLATALNHDYNARKLERFLIAAWESGASPVVLLTKADLCDDTEAVLQEVQSIALGVPVHCISVQDRLGLEQLDDYLTPGATIAVTGSSGVGKSTLLNWLAGHNVQEVQDIRNQDSRGRHTTTHRELFLLPSGALLIDTPGMRELQLWDTVEGWQHTFADIEQLAEQCRFRDCRHEAEQGCAVQLALSEGRLEPLRFANYRKTEKELAHLARKERNVHRKRKKESGHRPGSKPKHKKGFQGEVD